MQFENNRNNGDAVIAATSTQFPVLGGVVVPDGLGAYIPYNGKNLIKFTAPSTGTFTVGETVTGGTSTATGTVVSVNTGSIVITSLTGTFVSGETVTGGSSGATGVVALYIVRNKIYGINLQLFLSTDPLFAVAGQKIGVSTPVKIMDKLVVPITSGTANAALVGNYINVDPANPNGAIATAVANGMLYVTDFIDAATVMCLVALPV